MSGRLFICATPIGNLDDVSRRLLSTLGSADTIYAEDTRRTRTLLGALGITPPPLRSFFVGNENRRLGEIRARLEAGETVALVTDAGTPAVADPGLSAVRVADEVGAKVTVIPGPSAVTAAIALSGLPSDRFVFEGFLPRGGSGRRHRLAMLAEEERTMVLFSATRRVTRDLTDLGATLGGDRVVVVGRELTKVHEERWRGTLDEATAHWTEVEPRGEFTLVIAPLVKARKVDLSEAAAAVDALRREGLSLPEAVKRAATEHAVDRRRLYQDMVGVGGADPEVS
ncbi:MAG: 16S rRNA (cytidine(1402)-2'-O)-methyltransferase [Acidimicrobiia bacterium]